MDLIGWPELARGTVIRLYVFICLRVRVCVCCASSLSGTVHPTQSACCCSAQWGPVVVLAHKGGRISEKEKENDGRTHTLRLGSSLEAAP
jgi:hypothetical protein